MDHRTGHRLLGRLEAVSFFAALFKTHDKEITMTDSHAAAFTLHGFPVSPHVRSAQIAFLEKGLPLDFQAIGLDALATPEFGKLNPFRKMPVLVHGELVLYETPGLLVYADALGSGGKLQPETAADLATMWKFIGIAQNYLFPQGVMALYFNRVLAGIFGMEPDTAAADAAIPAVTTALDVLEAALVKSAFLAGSAMSLADIYCGTMVDYVGRTADGRTLLGSRPATAAWIAALRARESFKLTYAEMLHGTGEIVD